MRGLSDLMATFWSVSNMAKNRTRSLSAFLLFIYLFSYFLLCSYMCDGEELISANPKETRNEE
jgi:hypothetical protein